MREDWCNYGMRLEGGIDAEKDRFGIGSRSITANHINSVSACYPYM